ncbi:MAG: hypothetical protein K0S68_302 [Candidatus Saccharibacteria bacterium]|nr:hypothetical protein [Candidatus Saccharibacteria bacterium]
MTATSAPTPPTPTCTGVPLTDIQEHIDSLTLALTRRYQDDCAALAALVDRPEGIRVEPFMEGDGHVGPDGQEVGVIWFFKKNRSAAVLLFVSEFDEDYRPGMSGFVEPLTVARFGKSPTDPSVFDVRTVLSHLLYEVNSGRRPGSKQR